MSNSDAIKARIAELRRQRRAAIGIAERASGSARALWVKSNRAYAEAAQLAQDIEALGGKVRR